MILREILFRGKAANRKPGGSYRTKYKNGDWVYGLLTDPKNWAGYAEMTTTGGISGVEVDANSVGQFTGMTDKHGVDLYEGDIVTFSGETRFTVEYSTCRMGFYFSRLPNGGCIPGFTMAAWEHLEIIGNIHDNPELMHETVRDQAKQAGTS